ncbi:MAG TPA: mannose-1-phosphate guanylyltransferase [Acidimicrobiaceae bacterium]|nr:mannose-1-phosphate guanylyltransferase [Acidimicrobiaceae bacterium]
MRAVVLVGGFGTRLRPLTSDLPKQMLPIVDRPMIEHVVGHLAAHGVEEVVLSLGFLPDAFRDAYSDGRCAGIPLHYAVEPEPLDTAGAIRFAAEDAGIDEAFLVLNGDVLTDLAVDELIGFHRASGAEATVSLTPVDDPSRYGVVPTDADGRVTGFVEKPPAGAAPCNWINAGTYVFEPSVIDRIEPGRRVSVEREVFPAMADEGVLYGLRSEAYWVDTGTPETYLGVQLDLLDGVRGPARSGVDDAAEIHPGATVRRSVIGPGAVVAEGSRVCDSVVMAGSRIGEGAVVDGSLVGRNATIGPDARVLGLSVVGHGAEVVAGQHLTGDCRPEQG